MLYNIKGTGVAVTDEMRSYVEKRLAPLEKFFSRAPGARIDIEVEFLKDEARMYRAEGTLHDHGFNGSFRAEARGGTAHEAIDIMVNELSPMIARAKEKHVDNFRRGAAKIKDFIRGFRDRL